MMQQATDDEKRRHHLAVRRAWRAKNRAKVNAQINEWACKKYAEDPEYRERRKANANNWNNNNKGFIKEYRRRYDKGIPYSKAEYLEELKRKEESCAEA